MIQTLLLCMVIFFAVSVCAAGAGADAGAGESPLLRQVGTIPLPGVEGRIDHMAFDGRMLYVAALGNDTVEVIDPRAGKVIHTIGGLAQPQGLAAADGRLYAADAGDGICHIYDLKHYGPMGSIDFKSDADNVRYDAKANRIYVGFGDGALGVVDAAKGTRLGEIKLPAHPESFQLEAGAGRIFVNLPDADGAIAVIDRNKNAVVQTWHLTRAKANFPMALAGHHLLVACRKPATLIVLDTNTGKVISAAECAGDADDVWFDPTAARVYVSGGEGFLSIFALSQDGSLKPLGKVATAAGARTCYFSDATGQIYLAVPHRGDQAAEVRVYARR